MSEAKEKYYDLKKQADKCFEGLRDPIHDYVTELEQELTKLKESQTQWINVKDRLPEPNTGETFIVYINEGSIQTSWYSQDEDFLNPEFDYTDVTHWMPLPEIPDAL